MYGPLTSRASACLLALAAVALGGCDGCGEPPGASPDAGEARDAGTSAGDTGASAADASSGPADAGPSGGADAAGRPDAARPPDGGTGGPDAGPACGTACDPFSIVLVPDTQYYSSKQSAGPSNTYFKQLQWVVDNRASHNIRFVIHLGDVTHTNAVDEWQVASQAHQILDGANMPYSILPGNHDYLLNGEFGRSDTRLNDFFPPSRFQGKSWYGGSRGSGNETNYTLFEVGPMKFLVLSLEYGPRKESLCWAEQIIAQHPDRRVIIASHCVLTNGGKYDGNCPNVDYLVPGGDGATIWDELASRHSNVFLVVSGHVNDSEYAPRAGNSGNPVHQLLVDYQMEAACTLSSAAACTDHCHAGFWTGNGWMRELVFKPLENRVYARTFSVEAGNRAVFPGGTPALFCSPLNAAAGNRDYAADPHAPDHEFDFALDFSPVGADVRNDLGKTEFNDTTVNTAGAGQQILPVLARAADGRFVAVWEDDSSAADGASHDVAMRGFYSGGCQAFSQRFAHADTAGQQAAPAVAMAGDGRFVVAWEDDTDANGSFQIAARGFAADGQERFARLTVNVQAAGQQRRPAIAMATDGRFVVVWEDDADGDGSYQLRMRGLQADGSPGFAERSVHDDALGHRARPAAAMAPDGTFVVTWEDDSDGNGSFQIHQRAFAADGSPRYGPATVNATATGQQRRPVIGMDAQGGYVIAWEDDQDANGRFQIRLRGFEATGAQRFADVQAHLDSAGQRQAPTLGVAPDGAFVVGWEDDGDLNSSFQIRARGFSKAGVEKKAEWTINRHAAGQQKSPNLVLGPNGAMVSVWEDDMDGNNSTQLLAQGADLPGF